MLRQRQNSLNWRPPRDLASASANECRGTASTTPRILSGRTNIRHNGGKRKYTGADECSRPNKRFRRLVSNDGSENGQLSKRFKRQDSGGRSFVNLKEYGTLEATIRVAYEHPKLSAKHMSAVWTRISHLMRVTNHRAHSAQLSHELDTLLTRTLDGLSDFDPIRLSQTALSLAKIVKAVSKCGNGRTMVHYQMFDSLLIGNDAEKKKSTFGAIATAAAPLLERQRFDAQGYSNLAYACAIAEVVPKVRGQTLFHRIAEAVVSLKDLRNFEPQNLCNLVWAFATADISHHRLFETIADEVIEHRDLRSFVAQNVSNLVWAYATAKATDREMFEKVADHLLVERRRLTSCGPQHLANIVWAFATSKVYDRDLFETMGDAIVDRRREFNPQELSNTIWAFATSGLVDSPLFTELASTVSSMLRQFESQHLTSIAWAYSVANRDEPMLFDQRYSDILLERIDSFNCADMMELHQWHLWQRDEKGNSGLPSILEAKCHHAFVSLACAPRISNFQSEVVSVLRSLGLEVDEEVILERTGYSVDALVEIDGEDIAVEVDGPSHFIGRRPTGSTMLKRSQIKNLEDVALVSVPYFEWEEHSRKEEYIRALLKLR